MSDSNPCISCGACCACFRVSFYWSEASPEAGGIVPAELTIPVSPHLSAMRGTERKPSRCCALEGEIGQQVSCAIYPNRPTTCRGVQPSSSSERDEKCDKARLAHGLAVL